MNVTKTFKTLALVAVSTAGLYAGASQADFPGRGGYYNPYMPAPQVQHHQDFRNQVADFEKRLDMQLQRILKGIEAGKLTRDETIELLREHQAINTLERQYLADGRMGPRELADLDRRLDVAARNIKSEKRDRDRVAVNPRFDDWRR
jgi:hypothetical protein